MTRPTFDEYFYKNIASQARKYRLKKGITQECLSELLSKNDKYIGRIERCERKISNSMIIKLLDLWQIQPSKFYNFDNDYSWDKG